jgi:hypothetical protein
MWAGARERIKKHCNNMPKPNISPARNAIQAVSSILPVIVSGWLEARRGRVAEMARRRSGEVRRADKDCYPRPRRWRRGPANRRGFPSAPKSREDLPRNSTTRIEDDGRQRMSDPAASIEDARAHRGELSRTALLARNRSHHRLELELVLDFFKG